jgi:hypothetical protein
VVTWIQCAVIDIEIANLAGPTISARAREVVVRVNACRSVETRLNVTIVEIDVTCAADETSGTITSEAVDAVDTLATVNARVMTFYGYALIEIVQAIVTSVAGVALAVIVVYHDARIDVGAVCTPN